VTDGAKACKNRRFLQAKTKEKGERKKEGIIRQNKNGSYMQQELERRLFKFAIDVIKLLATLKTGKETDVIKHQLSKSATSAGANYLEAQAGSSKADFINKVAISLKEMRESSYWLEIVNELFPGSENANRLLKESEELSKIFASIILKSKS
jgi:four helix bundle protein